MKCHVCGGQMEDRMVKFCACDANPPLMVENVPAVVCDACGEQQFSDATVAVFERIRDDDVGRTGAILMRLYDFDRAVKGERIVTMHVLVGTEAASFRDSTLTLTHVHGGYEFAPNTAPPPDDAVFHRQQVASG